VYIKCVQIASEQSRSMTFVYGTKIFIEIYKQNIKPSGIFILMPTELPNT